ncbi:amidohydrolase family protein [Rhodococcus sp. WS3]|uniref:metal-dependent hydrolase family protein n=1 Tax=unclassified Rhodococcus (in: high G+C Gram-positive bacteria) TaxID=192944 RepID=UPI0005E3AAF9|nr:MULTISPECIES: amidohydrolase family protein [unclassified Rhodococcus (in: high G+C Gram-positive bacteria)]KJF19191.1 imidazolonepropionase [Rhodococcus sp. AD45]ROZ42822.1 amidohydrolase family protein [Rhodococcus sp. WS3]RZL20788.1 MAG: amidohydrolase family protein [Rhodococcus sp. (in: high G+C Gram-positive bacteria)]
MSTTTEHTVILADRVYLPHGEVLETAAVVLGGGTILWVGPESSLPKGYREEGSVHVPTLMPGLWDAHVHLLGLQHGAFDEILCTPLALSAMRIVADVGRLLDAGFTSVREMGGLGVIAGQAIDEGSVRGPKVHAAGAMISPTGGHADIHRYPVDFVAALSGPGFFYHQCDGVPECLRAVRLQVRAGAQVIKIATSGGVGSERDDPEAQNFSDDEIRAIVGEANRLGLAVAAHCLGKKGTLAALDAGVTTIEHGGDIDEEVADKMLSAGAVLVPTRLIIEDELALGAESGVPDFVLEKERRIAPRHQSSLEYAIERRIPIALGSDSYSSRPGQAAELGRNARELGCLARAGMRNQYVIDTATVNGPRTLGPRAPRSGQVAVGYEADLIAVQGEPIVDLSVLEDPSLISHVWKRGVLEKRPATGVGNSTPF